MEQILRGRICKKFPFQSSELICTHLSSYYIQASYLAKRALKYVRSKDNAHLCSLYAVSSGNSPSYNKHLIYGQDYCPMFHTKIV